MARFEVLFQIGRKKLKMRVFAANKLEAAKKIKEKLTILSVVELEDEAVKKFKEIFNM